MEHPKIGLALGSGGARGFAHLGVIKVLRDNGIPIHLIAGSSMGALVASFYAAGIEIERLYKLSTAFKRKYFLDFTVPKMGFIGGKKVKEFVKVFTHGKNIEDLSIPIGIVSTDLLTGEKVVFKTGPVANAVRASISIPGIFVPEKYNGRILVDGGVTDRVPISVAKEMGADIVIAVDVSSVKRNAEITSIYDVIMQSIDIMQTEVINSREPSASIMIRPPVESYSSRAFTNTQEIINIGEEEAKKHINQIQAEIGKWKE
ncbi:patatin-like phospholipase family protein [Bacillus sp. BRMEA1]|uniref:patatin-like phospholipase family protein n=1 Tax=Neobacillus endophyticus TaxID=2738405 RepID=UPI001566B690|nr:patatin-like phospholipase family protein [Neobacillus endophyticus]NRD78763.1 patatin-like phospholipase family protein [Neobacillus endophyticus]